MEHKIVTKYVTEAGVVAESVVVSTGDGELVYSGSVPASGTQEIDLAFDETKVKSIFVTASQATDFEFVGASQHIHVPAGGCYAWSVNGPTEEQFVVADPVTSISAVNASSTKASVIEIRVLLDVTP